ncbi:signal peptidase I [Salinisphaera dokdonensis CL-ES53]|uniref:Signal peptidase I n=1 Tax=Salinisphaera dokdonensis CL-ES53 TaxID=1304272 RepID=A0ABV2B2E5_9GAMM
MNNVHMDFEAWLAIATLVTGVVWLVDRLVLRARRGPHEEANAVIEFARSFFPVLIAVLVLRAFVFEPFRIPSKSMVPTLLVGDFVLVNKFSYGLRAPVFHTKFLDLGEPERGDVVVFRYPPDPTKDYIKRVIGMPGDQVAYADEQLFINGDPVSLEDLGIYNGPDGEAFSTMREFVESLPNGAKHPVLQVEGRRGPDVSVTVPQDHFFVMGDNRDNSADSRVWGFVPERNLVGKAFMIWMSVDFGEFDVRFDRIGNILH